MNNIFIDINKAEILLEYLFPVGDATCLLVDFFPVNHACVIVSNYFHESNAFRLCQITLLPLKELHCSFNKVFNSTDIMPPV